MSAHWLRFALCALVASAAVSREALAQTLPPAHRSPSNVPRIEAAPAPPANNEPPPGTVEVAGKSYPATIGGMREYLDSLRTSEPGVFSQLDPSLSSLETRRTIGWTVLIGGIATGLAVMVLAKPSAPFSDSTGFAVGGAIAVAGGVTGYLLMPGKSAVEEWIDEHNRVKNSDPIRFRLAFAPARGGGIAMLTLDWGR